MRKHSVQSRRAAVPILRWLANRALVMSVMFGETELLVADEVLEQVSNDQGASPRGQDTPATPDAGPPVPPDALEGAETSKEAPDDLPAPNAEPKLESPSDPEALLDAALEAMDQAVQELEGDAPTSKAVADQQMAVDRLKELLAAASQSQSGNSKSSSKNKPASEPDSLEENPSESSSSDPNGSGGRRSDDENSAESSENVAGPTLPGTGVLAPGAKANNVWGHLPPREREALFRSLSDNFLPEYEAQIKRYYEALAERK